MARQDSDCVLYVRVAPAALEKPALTFAVRMASPLAAQLLGESSLVGTKGQHKDVSAVMVHHLGQTTKRLDQHGRQNVALALVLAGSQRQHQSQK